MQVGTDIPLFEKSVNVGDGVSDNVTTSLGERDNCNIIMRIWETRYNFSLTKDKDIDITKKIEKDTQ